MSKEYSKIKAKNNMEVSRDVDVESDSPQVAERPKLQGVVGVSPKKVKRSLLSRLIKGLAGPEGISGIGGYVSEEIVKPAVKNIIVDTVTSSANIIIDAITSGINMRMFGEKGAPNRGRYYSGGQSHNPRNNYSNMYNSRPSQDRGNGREPVIEPRSNGNIISRTSRYGVEEYVIQDRYDAAHVLTTLTECADRYGKVSVADYYDLINVSSNFTDNSYGWNHEVISTARIVPDRGGYVIKFPPVEIL